jgi:hypothetical protein
VPKVEMMRVYVVDVSHGDCSADDCPLVCHGGDRQFVYDEWDAAAARMRQFLDTRPHGCQGSICLGVELMTPEEFAALLPDEDPAPAAGEPA